MIYSNFLINNKKMHKMIFYYVYFILLILIQLCNNYIILPFTSINPSYNLTYDNSSDFISKFTNELNKKKLYTKIPIGESKNDSIFFLTMKDYFAVIKNSCPKGTKESFYEPYESSSFSLDPKSSSTYYDLFNAKLGNDKCSIFNDKNMNEHFIVNMDILVDNQSYSGKKEEYELDKYCGRIGLIIRSSYPYYYSNFIRFLKINDIIKSYQWGIFFFDKEQSYNINKEIQNKYEGFFIAGLEENDYINIFNTNNIYNTNEEMSIFTMLGGKFNEIYFKYMNNKIICSYDTLFEVNVEQNYILCQKVYFNNIKKYFFNKYIDNKICQEIFSDNKNNKGDSMIMCNLEFKNEWKNFPKLCLFYNNLNFTFYLDYKDLFIEIKNKIYFLIISTERSNYYWNFGNILIKKYPFMFNQDKKQIYFIHLKKYDLESENNDDENENDNKINDISFWNKYKLYIVIALLSIFVIVSGIIGFIFGRKLWIKNRKKRACELDDNYYYTKNIDNDKDSNIIN